MRTAMQSVAILAICLFALAVVPAPAGATTCDSDRKALVNVLLLADALAITTNVIGIAIQKPNSGVAGLGIISGVATLLNVNVLRDRCDPPSDRYIHMVAVAGAASIMVGVYAIYRDARHSVTIAPAPVMGEACVAAQLTVRF